MARLLGAVSCLGALGALGALGTAGCHSPDLDDASAASADERLRQQSLAACEPVGSGARLWLRADDLALADGAGVASWSSASSSGSSGSSGYTASNAVAGQRPRWRAQAIGGRAAVAFDGSDDRLDLSSNAFAAGGFPLTVVAVLRTADAEAHVAGTGSSSAGYLATYGGALALRGGAATIKANSGGAGLLLAGTGSGALGTLADGAPHVVTAVAAAASALFVDGVAAGTSTTPPGVYAYGKATIGASDGSSSGASIDPFAGELAELIVFAGALATAERAALEACLGAKYGVAVAAPMGCDGVAGSGLAVDACGVCGGDGASCAAVVPSGLALWLRADDLAASVAPGAALASWTDASGSGNHAGQSATARRPTLLPGSASAPTGPTGSTGIGGHAAVRFDGADDRLDLASNVFAAGGAPLAVFAVVETADLEAHLVGTGSSSPGYLTSYGNALTLLAGKPTLKANSAGAGLHLPAASPLGSAPRLVSAVLQAGQPAAASSLAIGCAEQGLPNAAPSAYAYGKSTIGASDGSSAGASIDPFSGELAELIVYRRALSAEERAAIEQYLTAKYQLAACVHAPPDPALSLASSAVMFFKLDEDGPGPRADAASGLSVYPFDAPNGNAASIPAIPAVIGAGQRIYGPTDAHFWRSSAAPMQRAGGSFTWAGWMSVASYYDDQTFVGKWNATPAQREYRVLLDKTSHQLRFEVASGAGELAVVHPTPLLLGTFYFIEAWYDAGAATVNLRVGTQASRGAVVSLPWSGGVRDGAADLNLAAHNTCTDDFLDGTLDAVGFWRRVLSAAESQRLWNGGAGFEP